MQSLVIGLLLGHVMLHVTVTSANKNVLLIMADDLRPDLNLYSELGIRTNDVSTTFVTPNLDALANNSIVFTKAYTQFPVCGPSRASILTGRYPDTIQVHGLHDDPRGRNGNITTLPQYFREAGYATYGYGKIFHDDDKEHGYGFSWDDFNRPTDDYVKTSKSWKTVNNNKRSNNPLVDDLIRDKVINKLTDLAPDALAGNKSFFLAAGFKKPHLPWVFPDDYLNIYPMDVDVPVDRLVPVNYPEIAWSKCKELCSSSDIQTLVNRGTYDCDDYNNKMSKGKVQELRRAYYASITYIDDLIGEVLDHLKSLGLYDDTIVLFMSDHGWQLSDHNGWCKTTNFEDSLRIPMILRVPGDTDAGLVSHKLVEALDVMPTLIAAAGLGPLDPCPATDPIDDDTCGEGRSLLPLVANPTEPNWRTYAFSQVTRDGQNIPFAADDTMGYSVTDGEFRYNVYTKYNYSNAEPEFKPTIDRYDDKGLSELYALDIDPFQTVNLIDPQNPENSTIEAWEDVYFDEIRAKFEI